MGLNDTLICLEMPFFAIAHNYAFSYKDFIDLHISYVARMPFCYAFRDAFGLRDVVEDSKTTLRGEGMDYREFEPAEGFMHQGVGRDRRIRAGLRYSRGGQRKYWLPKAAPEPPGRAERTINRAIARVAGRDQAEEVHAPLLPSQAHNVVHLAPDLQHDDEEHDVWENQGHAEDGYELPFGDLDDEDEELFAHSKKYVFGDYNYPCIDVSSEQARLAMWTEEERVLRDERGAWFSPIRGAKGRLAIRGRERPAWEGYGAVGTTAQGSRHVGGNFYDINDDGDGKIIDHERDKVGANGDLDDPRAPAVKLQWTKVRGTGAKSPAAISSRPSYSSPSSQSKSGAQSHKPHGHPVDSKSKPERTSSGPSSTGSSNQSLGIAGASDVNRVRSPPSMSRGNSRRTHSGSRDRSPMLPPDAVDLVVEDNKAAQQEQTRERRKGEPATRGLGLRKIYRRGFEVETLDGEITGEVEVEDSEADQKRVNAGEQILDRIKHDNDGGMRHHRQYSQEPQIWEPDNSEGVVARARTPPLHARLSTNHHYDIPEHDNPWA